MQSYGIPCRPGCQPEQACLPGALDCWSTSEISRLTLPYLSLTTDQDWFLCPWFPWIKTVTKGREPGISRRSYEHKPGYFERKREENKTSCSIHCLLLRFSKTCEFQSSKANWRLRFSLPSIILADLSGNRNLLQQVQKVMACDWWLVNFQSVLCVPVFQGLLLVIVVMIDGSEKCNCEGGCVFEKHSK